MPLGMKADLGPGHVVLDGDPAPTPAKGAQRSPLFSAHVYYPRSPVSATTELLFQLFC